MHRTSRFTATALAALLTAAPAVAFAATGMNSATGLSSPTSTPGTSSGSANMSPGSATQNSSADQGNNSGTTSQSYNGGSQSGNSASGDTEHQQVSQDTLQNVQQQLQQQGFYKNAKVDGKWGPQTRQAVQSFQQAKGLPATGQLDQQTLGALGVNQGG